MIKSYTGDPAAIGDYGSLSDETGTRTFNLRIVRTTTKGVIARLAGVTDRNAAEELRGTKLFVDRDRLPAVEDEDEFYHTDLIGLTAQSHTGEVIGKVVAVENFGAGDLLEIKEPEKKNTELVPFSKNFVPKVDLAAGTVTVNWPIQSTDGEPTSENNKND